MAVFVFALMNVWFNGWVIWTVPKKFMLTVLVEAA